MRLDSVRRCARSTAEIESSCTAPSRRIASSTSPARARRKRGAYACVDTASRRIAVRLTVVVAIHPYLAGSCYAAPSDSIASRPCRARDAGTRGPRPARFSSGCSSRPSSSRPASQGGRSGTTPRSGSRRRPSCTRSRSGRRLLRRRPLLRHPTTTSGGTTKSSGGGGGSAAAGQAVFAANGCASCHTFKPANATGTIGPDLDKAPAPMRRQTTTWSSRTSSRSRSRIRTPTSQGLQQGDHAHDVRQVPLEQAAARPRRLHRLGQLELLSSSPGGGGPYLPNCRGPLVPTTGVLLCGWRGWPNLSAPSMSGAPSPRSQGLDELIERPAALVAAADRVGQHDRRIAPAPGMRPRLDRPGQQPHPTQEQHERHERQQQRHEEKPERKRPGPGARRHPAPDATCRPPRCVAEWQRRACRSASSDACPSARSDA